MTYDEFLSLNDDHLMILNVTLGARKRLLSNIEHLNGRYARLKKILAEFDEIFQNETSIEASLEELLEISVTPMKCQLSKLTSLNSLSLETSYHHKSYLNDENKQDLATIFILILEKCKFKL